MPFIWLGLIGFMLFFVYDINQVFIKNKFLSLQFLMGFILVVVATVGILFYDSHFALPLLGKVVVLLMAVLFLGLTVYSLFFAIPFKKTYCEAEQFALCTKGAYGLCRHPALPCFMLFYLSLWAFTGIDFVLLAFIVFGGCNILYSLFQDYYIFPKIFEGYPAYRLATPFMFPSRATFKGFITNLQKNKVVMEIIK